MFKKYTIVAYNKNSGINPDEICDLEPNDTNGNRTSYIAEFARSGIDLCHSLNRASESGKIHGLYLEPTDGDAHIPLVELLLGKQLAVCVDNSQDIFNIDQINEKVYNAHLDKQTNGDETLLQLYKDSSEITLGISIDEFIEAQYNSPWWQMAGHSFEFFTLKPLEVK